MSAEQHTHDAQLTGAEAREFWAYHMAWVDRAHLLGWWDRSLWFTHEERQRYVIRLAKAGRRRRRGIP